MRSRREHRSFFVRYRIYFGIAGILVLLFLVRPGGVVERGMLSLGKPLWSFSGGLNGWFASKTLLLESKKHLIEANKALREENNALKAQNQTVQALRNTNESFTELLHKSTHANQKLAGILMMPPTLPYDNLLIDAGSSDGVTSGDQVFAYGDIALGVVTTVAPRTARVSLYSSPGIKTNALLLSGTSTLAVEAEGMGGGNFRIALPRGTSVATDSPVVLPGAQSILLGTVGAVFEKSTDAFETALVASPVSIRSLRFVEIVKKAE